MATAVWGSGKWGQDTWGGQHWPPGASWRGRWRWWYQLGKDSSTVVELTGLVIDARWTTDANHVGDGSFRGDIQPGQVTVRFYDPHGVLPGLNRSGQIWAFCDLCDAAWVWFVTGVTTRLDNPTGLGRYEVVVDGSTWPTWLTTDSQYNAGANAETVASRLSGIANRWSVTSGILLPATTSNIAAATWQVPAVALNTYGYYLSDLQQIRNTAASGVAWITPFGGLTVGTLGTWALNYDWWERADVRDLHSAQVIAQTDWSQTTGDMYVSQVQWQSTKADGSTVNLNQGPSRSGPMLPAGWVSTPTMRVWGDITMTSGAQYAAVSATGYQLLTDRGDPAKAFVDTVYLASGDRRTPAGALVAWDPSAHIWGPTDVLRWARVSGQPAELYRVAQSTHFLSARVWQTALTLELYTAPTHIP